MAAPTSPFAHRHAQSAAGVRPRRPSSRVRVRIRIHSTFDLVLLSIMIVNELTVLASLTVPCSSEGFVKCCALTPPFRALAWPVRQRTHHSLSGVGWLPATSPRWVRRPSRDGEPTEVPGGAPNPRAMSLCSVSSGDGRRHRLRWGSGCICSLVPSTLDERSLLSPLVRWSRVAGAWVPLTCPRVVHPMKSCFLASHPTTSPLLRFGPVRKDVACVAFCFNHPATKTRGASWSQSVSAGMFLWCAAACAGDGGEMRCNDQGCLVHSISDPHTAVAKHVVDNAPRSDEVTCPR